MENNANKVQETTPVESPFVESILQKYNVDRESGERLIVWLNTAMKKLQEMTPDHIDLENITDEGKREELEKTLREFAKLEADLETKYLNAGTELFIQETPELSDDMRKNLETAVKENRGNASAAVESLPAEMKTVEKKGLMSMDISVPPGEHWQVKGLNGVTLTVEPGAELSVKGAVDSKIIIKKGGKLNESAGLVKTEVVDENQ